MPLNSHRRYQKAHYIEVNHERGCLFEHILVPTLPEARATPMDSRSLQRSTRPFAYHSLCMFLQVTAINKHDFLAEAGFSKRPDIKPFFWPLLKTTAIFR